MEDVSVTVVEQIADIGPAWNRCFPGELEDYDYYRVVEGCGLEGFSFFYVVARRGDAIVAVAPGFVTRYRLDSTVSGPAKRVTDALARRLPWLLSLPLACLGSPVAERCHLGFVPEVPDADRAVICDRMVAATEAWARMRGIGLVGIKDVSATETYWGGLDARGYAKLPSLPGAVLDITGFATLKDYLAVLSAGTRKDMSRKLKTRPRVTIERTRDLGTDRDRVLALYAATRAASDLQFETLPPRYFTDLLAVPGGPAECVLYRVDGEILAFNLVLRTGARLIDKFFGMDRIRGRDFNLYFLSWFENVETCIHNGIPTYESGQAELATKLKLGSQPVPLDLHFRHRNPIANRVLRLVAKFVSPDNFEATRAPARDGALA